MLQGVHVLVRSRAYLYSHVAEQPTRVCARDIAFSGRLNNLEVMEQDVAARGEECQSRDIWQHTAQHTAVLIVTNTIQHHSQQQGGDKNRK
jgi:hypothetical protein